MMRQLSGQNLRDKRKSDNSIFTRKQFEFHIFIHTEKTRRSWDSNPLPKDAKAASPPLSQVGTILALVKVQ